MMRVLIAAGLLGLGALTSASYSAEGDTCGGFIGLRCAANEYCRHPDGMCAEHGADLSGNCAVKPEACTKIYEPVCGCDGKTYGNSCEAAAAGSSVDHPGLCAS